MKVLIYGLLNDHARMMKAEFPSLDLRFERPDTKHGGNSADQANTADRIIVMTKFTSHSLTGKLDKSKTTLIPGGITKLRALLQTLAITARLEEPPRPRVITQNEYEESHMPVEMLDFSPIKHAKVGDVFSFKRPPKKTLEQFKLMVMQGRSYYKRTAGVLSEQHPNGDAIDVIVVGHVEAKVEPRVEQISGHASLPLAKIGAFLSPPPAPAATADDVPCSTLEHRFWQEVYLMCMKTQPGSPGSWASDATQALTDYRKAVGAA